jgi:sec-independent protein translocase protein TatA
MILGNILGPDAIIVVVLALILLFGAGRLPHLARSMGEASKEFKRGSRRRRPLRPRCAPLSRTRPPKNGSP